MSHDEIEQKGKELLETAKAVVNSVIAGESKIIGGGAGEMVKKGKGKQPPIKTGLWELVVIYKPTGKKEEKQ